LAGYGTGAANVWFLWVQIHGLNDFCKTILIFLFPIFLKGVDISATAAFRKGQYSNYPNSEIILNGLSI